MKTIYTFTLTANFCADNASEARQSFAEWLGTRGVAEYAVVTIEESAVTAAVPSSRHRATD